MKFRRLPLERAAGHILGHNVSHAGRRVLKKGRRLGAAELVQLAEAGQAEIYVAVLEPGDVEEDAAALRVARALARAGALELRPAHGGRVSLEAPALGVLSVARAALLELNLVEGVTLATLPGHSVVAPGQRVGTLKVVPFALPELVVGAAEGLASRAPLAFRPLAPRRVHLLVSGAESRRERLLGAYQAALSARVCALGEHRMSASYVALGADPERELADAVAAQLAAGADLLILASETATMDGDDLAPRAIRRAGGEVDVVGAPVFPGNLLLIGHRGAARILGAPGCVRSREGNVVDLLLPRLLLGDRLERRDVAELGHGGLLGAGSHEASQDG